MLAACIDTVIHGGIGVDSFRVNAECSMDPSFMGGRLGISGHRSCEFAVLVHRTFLLRIRRCFGAHGSGPIEL